MPDRIEKALDFPVVSEVIKVAGETSVVKYIHYELIKLAALVSVGGNLNDMQAAFIAQELVKVFPNETLADFKLCFQRGAIGQYGEIYRMDGIVIRGWMEKYLEEKYKVIENKLMSEKDDLYKIPQTITEEVQDQKIKDRLQEWKAAIEQAANDKTIRPLTDEEIRKEGQIKPAAKEPYRNGFELERDNQQVLIQRAASEFYKSRYTFTGFKIFLVAGFNVFAESEDDAIEIYKKATE